LFRFAFTERGGEKCCAFFAANLRFFHRQQRRTFTPAPGAPQQVAARSRLRRDLGERRSPAGRGREGSALLLFYAHCAFNKCNV
jgi:hypothetical protein